jgi:RNA polymerase sigma-70 factor (ECF subfamily)
VTALQGLNTLGAEAISAPGGLLSMDDEAFRAFHAATSRALWAYLVGACGDRALADDVLQEAYLRLLRATRFVPESEEHRRRYLFRIAANLLRDHARSPHRREQELSPVHEEKPSPPTAPGLRTDVERAMARLPERERRLLWLAHVEGWSHDEIANELDVKAGSVRVLLFRARQRLAGLLRDAGFVPAGGEA